MKRFISIFISVLLIISLFVGCKNEEVIVSVKSYSNMNFKNERVEDGIICENDKLLLYWNDIYKQVMLTDKQSGKVYSTMPTEAMEIRYDESGMEILNNPQIESPIIVYYYSSASMDDATSFAATDAIYEGDVYTELIDNGIRVTYDFFNLEISVPVEYTISEESFDISINPKEISDNGERFVTGVAVAPFICGIKNDTENSYLFLPDGSGTLIEPKTIDLIGKQNSFSVYGDDLTVSGFTVESYKKQIHLPVFGSKTGDSGIVGIITSAAEQAELLTNVGSQNVGYSTVYPFFRIKGYNTVKQPPRFLSANYQVKLYGKSIVTTPLKVSYYFLLGDNADYNGMAEVYRNYLIKNKGLAESSKKETAVNIKILGGVQKKAYTFGIPRTVLHSLTTVEQAQDMSKYFSDNIDGKLLVELYGFGESGMDIGKVGGGFKVAKQLGSKKEISKFNNLCVENDISLFMDFEILKFNEGKQKSAKFPNGQTAYLYTFDNITRNTTDERYMLLARSVLTENAEEALKSIISYGFTGIAFETLSSSVYSDYAQNNTQVSAGMSNYVYKLFGAVRKNKELLSHNANDYVAVSSDYVIDAPMTSSGYNIESVSVPFYQMVFKGYVPLGSESVNLSEDWHDAILHCAESGVSPTFTLLYDNDETIVASEFSSLYGSSYKGIKEKIVESSNELQKLLSKINGAKIINHNICDNGLRITTFDNGIKVAVNYTDDSITIDEKTVEKNSYTVWEGM